MFRRIHPSQNFDEELWLRFNGLARLRRFWISSTIASGISHPRWRTKLLSPLAQGVATTPAWLHLARTRERRKSLSGLDVDSGAVKCRRKQRGQRIECGLIGNCAQYKVVAPFADDIAGPSNSDSKGRVSGVWLELTREQWR